jgi:DNA-binding response OmpR family regulator
METAKKVLIIEDDVDLVEAVKTVLESSNIQVSAAYQPEEGYLMAEREKPDLIILDVMFGKKGRTEGFDLARKFRQNPGLAHIPILVATSVNAEFPGFNFSGKDKEFLPVDDFIYKPANPGVLLDKVKSLMAMRVGVS